MPAVWMLIFGAPGLAWIADLLATAVAPEIHGRTLYDVILFWGFINTFLYFGCLCIVGLIFNIEDGTADKYSNQIPRIAAVSNLLVVVFYILVMITGQMGNHSQGYAGPLALILASASVVTRTTLAWLYFEYHKFLKANPDI